MQTELVSRIEKIWSMSDIALKHGSVEYGFDGHSKVVRLAGLRFKFKGDVLVRIRGGKLDVSIVHHEPQANTVFFPGSQTLIHFSIGDDDVLSRVHSELCALQNIFSVRRAA